jgi:hypothetical protein
MRKKTRYSSIVAIIVSCGIIMFSYLCSLVADFTYHTPFKAITVETLEEGSPSLNASVVGEVDSVEEESTYIDPEEIKRRDSRFGGDGEYSRL